MVKKLPISHFEALLAFPRWLNPSRRCSVFANGIQILKLPTVNSANSDFKVKYTKSKHFYDFKYVKLILNNN